MMPNEQVSALTEEECAALINLLLSLFAVLYVLHIISNRNESTYKTLWLLVILGLPVFGTILYFCFGNKRTAKADHLSTQALCTERTLDNIGVSFKKWVMDGLLRIFAPLC